MGWFRKMFGRGEKKQYAENDMRIAPVDNPLDVREDGSIRPGDPAWDYMMEVMKSGKVMTANQRADGTWETKEL